MLDSDLVLAHRLASVAGGLALPFFRRSVERRIKRDGTVVSEVDRRIEREILRLLASERPNDSVLAEESGEHGPTGSSRRWIIDPLDMTESFLGGRPGWGTHVTLECDGELELAVISRPVNSLRWWAKRGSGAYRSRDYSPLSQSTRLSVSRTSRLAEAKVGGFARPDSETRRVLAGLAQWTSDRYCIVGAMAEGRLDAFIDDGGSAWDQGPAVLIVEEAGGRFFDPEGGRRIDKRWGLYVNSALGDELGRRLLPPPQSPSRV